MADIGLCALPFGFGPASEGNAQLLASPAFQRGFVEAVDRARTSDLTLPLDFCGPPLGAHDIARDLTAYLRA